VLQVFDGVELIFGGVEWSRFRCLDKLLWNGEFGGVKKKPK